jgi:hypothetical protein
MFIAVLKKLPVAGSNFPEDSKVAGKNLRPLKEHISLYLAHFKL